MRDLKLYFLLFLISSICRSQQESNFSYYMFNHQAINPAYTGSRGITNLTSVIRSQWVGLEGAPETQTITFGKSINSKNLGYGVSVLNDKIGPISSSRVAIDLAYHLQINSSYLSIGIKTGFNNFNFDQNVIQTTTPNDLSFTFDDEGEFLPNIGFGFYYHSPSWYAGFSVPWFIENESFNIQRHYFGIIGGLVRISNSFEAKPSLLVKKTKGSTFTYDFSFLFLYKTLFWVGPQTRSNLKKGVPSNEFGGGFGIIAGVNLNKNVSIGYSYNTSALGNLITTNHSTHEIMLRFDLIPALKNILRSPRIF